VKRKYNLASVKQLAQSRGGKFLSKTDKIILLNSYEWECRQGHNFTKRLSDVDAGQWCRDCSTGLYERICRAHFESIFGVKFPNVRNLDWLINEHGNHIELDGYNKELRIAFEHQGQHHYKENAFFEKPLYDEIKKELCKKNDVKLICIPELYTNIKIKDLLDFLKKEFAKNNISFDESISFEEIDLKNAYAPEYLKELKALARNRNFKLLSNVYIGPNELYDFKCIKRGHEFSRIRYKLDECPFCRYEVKVLGRYYTNLETACNKHQVSYDAATRRLRMYKETPDESIKILKQTTQYKINGESFIGRTKEEICQYLDINTKSVDGYKLRNNSSFEEACEHYIKNKDNKIIVNSIKFNSFSEAARYYDLGIEHLYLLRQDNLSEEAAINQMLSNKDELKVIYNNKSYNSMKEACKQLNISYRAAFNQKRRKNISPAEAIANVITNNNKRERN
tara:strand:- start:448 stop:1803 length:1356 start_codon:yes stop_codon:yes gene_type:complete